MFAMLRYPLSEHKSWWFLPYFHHKLHKARLINSAFRICSERLQVFDVNCIGAACLEWCTLYFFIEFFKCKATGR